MTVMLRDDPRLTAYALGELAGDDLVTLERQLVSDSEASAEVARIREVTHQLDEAMASEFAATLPPALTSAQHAAIRHAAAPRRLNWGIVVSGLGAAIAASLLVMVSVAVGGRSPEPVAASSPSPRLAQVKKPTAVDHPNTAPLPVLTVAPGASAAASSPSVIIEAPPLTQLHVELAEREVETTDDAESQKEIAKGREEAVASSELGSTGAFMAIGSSGWNRKSGSRVGGVGDTKRADEALRSQMGYSDAVTEHLRASHDADAQAKVETDSARRQALQLRAKCPKSG